GGGNGGGGNGGGQNALERMSADKIIDVVMYDFCGPAHCDSINIAYVLDARVEVKRDMCDLWVLDKNGNLISNVGSMSTPFPQR
ncbi:MAG: hypothetical protein GX946_04380, partial [Oligosphaeraceae bacterium]|nr:hypothetical protein [Oligosphaeraceae bacterium]